MAVKVNKVITIPLTEIVVSFFVRQAVDEDHVIYLAELYEAGVKLPPIQLTEDTHELIDGRHRKAAADLLGWKQLPAELIPPMSRAELIVAAFSANYGGALKPTRSDIEHTVELLIDQGLSTPMIVDVLPLPKSMARKYVSFVRSNINKRQLNRAMGAVADGHMNVAEAAEKYSVDPETLKDSLRGTKKKKKNALDSIKGELSSRTKSFSLKNANIAKRMIESYQDGDSTEKDARDVLEYIDRLITRSHHAHKDWMARFDALAKNDSASFPDGDQ